MKSKLNLKLILITLLLVLLSLALVACGNKSGGGEGGGDEGGGGDKPVATTFTVSFDSNGSSMAYDSQQVVYGGKVANPNKGNPDNDPYKVGYIFKWWSLASNTDVAWNFDTDTITSAITLVAVYKANTYIHTLDINSTNPDAHCDFDTFTSTYNQSTTMPIPTCMDDHGNASDQFLYWYYLDADNKEVRFSYWISYTMQTSSSKYSPGTDYFTRDHSTYYIPVDQPQGQEDFNKDNIKYYVQNSLSESSVFTLDKVLTLKAKWYSQLPTTPDDEDPISAHTVVLLPDNGSAETSVVVKYNDTVDPVAEPIKANYKFDGWYVAVENENGTIEYDGKTYSLTSTEFHFDTGIGAAQFDLVTDDMVLAAKWTRYFEITSAGDWDTLAAKINVDESATEDEKKESQELLAGKIQLAADITLNESYSMILGAFSGEFDGQYDNSGVLENHTITFSLGSTFAPTNKTIALFENITGTVKHVNITINHDLHKLDADPDIFEEGYNKTFYIGGLAGELNKATIQNVNIDATIAIPNDPDTSYADYGFTVGGLAAYMTNTEVTATWTVTGSLSIEALGKDVRVGGLAAKAAYSTISQGSSSHIAISATSNGSATVGGIIGEAVSSEITTTNISSDTIAPTYIEVTSINDTAYVGGIVGKLVYSSVSKCYITGTKDYIAKVYGTALSKDAAVGGLVGLNQGNVNNSYVQYANVEVTALTISYAGGIAGKCFNDSSSYACGKIEYCYIASIMTADDDIALQDAIKATSYNENSTAYAGGITAYSDGCSIARSFAYTGVKVDVSNGYKGYSLGYISAHRNASSSIDTSYTDIESKVTLTSYPMVAMKVAETNGETYTYNFDTEYAFNIELNGANNTIGTTSFKDGQFVYSTMGWNNNVWNLFDPVTIIYVTDLPTLRA